MRSNSSTIGRFRFRFSKFVIYHRRQHRRLTRSTDVRLIYMKDSLGLKVETLLAKASILLITSGNWSFFLREIAFVVVLSFSIHILNVDGNTAPNPTSTNQMNFVPC